MLSFIVGLFLGVTIITMSIMQVASDSDDKLMGDAQYHD